MKTIDIDFLSLLPSNVAALVKELSEMVKKSAYNGHVYIVGGSVRDALLGKKEVKDLDLVIDIPSGGIGFANWLAYRRGCHIPEKNPCEFPTYGTAKLVLLNSPEYSDIDIECVQTRKEKYNRESRNPNQVFGSVQEDAMRRDLTINALYYNITDGKIYDFTGKGLSDLENHIIRTTGEPDMIFDDDPLRILRVCRFATRLGWGIESKTWCGMVTNSKRISILTQERVTDEINKMLLCDTPSKAIETMLRCNVLDMVLPFMSMMRHVYQDLRPLRSVYEHTLQCIDNTPKNLNTRLAALFHDIGKIETYKNNFVFHHLKGASMAEIVMKAMKYSNTTIDTVRLAIEHHDDFSSWRGASSVPRPQVIRKFVANFDTNEQALDVTLDLIHANNITQMFGKRVNQVKGIRDKIAELEKKNESGKKLVIPVKGEDIMREFNLKPSPFLGQLVTFAKSKVIENPSLTKEECLKLIGEHIKKLV